MGCQNKLHNWDSNTPHSDVVTEHPITYQQIPHQSTHDLHTLHDRNNVHHLPNLCVHKLSPVQDRGSLTQPQHAFTAHPYTQVLRKFFTQNLTHSDPPIPTRPNPPPTTLWLDRLPATHGLPCQTFMLTITVNVEGRGWVPSTTYLLYHLTIVRPCVPAHGNALNNKKVRHHLIR